MQSDKTEIMIKTLIHTLVKKKEKLLLLYPFLFLMQVIYIPDKGIGKGGGVGGGGWRTPHFLGETLYISYIQICHFSYFF